MIAGAAVHGRLDPSGRLVEADPALAALQREAGGELGELIALPPLASLARLVRRLGVAISRPVRVADGEGDLHLFVRAVPEGESVALAIASWDRSAAAARAHLDERTRVGADWTWEADAGLAFTSLSPQAAWRLGRPLDRLIGQPISAVFRLVEAGAGDLPLLTGLATQSRVDAQIAVLRTPPAHAYRLAAQPVLDPDGHFAGFRGTATRIADVNAEPNETFAASNTPAAPSLAPDRLGTALKRPLMQIVAQAEAIAGGEAGPLRRDYADYAADIGGAARHLMSLVDDLLDLEAVERADFRPAAEAIDLAEIARRAAGLFAVRAADAGITIERPSSVATCAAVGEYRRVLQIAVNIVGNAVRHAPPASAVRIEVASRDGRALLAVSDHGAGIAEADQARIFDKFVRLAPAEGEGSGLGLYISRRLARAMEGDLRVESRPGGGTRFTLVLPPGLAA